MLWHCGMHVLQNVWTSNNIITKATMIVCLLSNFVYEFKQNCTLDCKSNMMHGFSFVIWKFTDWPVGNPFESSELSRRYNCSSWNFQCFGISANTFRVFKEVDWYRFWSSHVSPWACKELSSVKSSETWSSSTNLWVN